MSGLDKTTFNRFRNLVYEKSGITLGEQKVALVSARISKRMRALGLATYSEYYEYVVRDKSGQELVHMLDAISTNVTSFFREEDHFHFLAEALCKWRKAGQKRFRIWSAACSTGEEPYTIAMVMQEYLDDRKSDIKILATDLSTRVLERCLVGEYDRDKLHTVSSVLREKYFEHQLEKDHYKVSETLRSMVMFRRLNLSTPPFKIKGPLDVVFCRNVMIYFDNEVRGRLLGEIYRVLKPGGYLMVGHAESLTGIVTQFRTVKPSIYIK